MSRPPIVASTRPDAAGFAARLAARAERIARAHAARLRMAQAARWRNARLLWPLFTED